MQTPLEEINKARQLPFVDDVTLAPNSHLYIVSMKYEYPDILRPGKNYLTIDASSFSVDAVIDAFDKVVVQYYRGHLSRAEGLLHDAKRQQGGLTDIMNEL